MKACVVIPSYNEAKTIGGIIGELKAKKIDVLVVDDGSSDDTAQIAKGAGATVITHPRNLGKGASIKEAFNFIMNSKQYDAVVIMDGDGQHHTEDIDRFLEHAEAHSDDLVVGNRMGYTKNMPLDRFLTNKITSFLISSICKQNIPDTQCGFRLIRKEAIGKLKLSSSNYDTESEMLIYASRKGLKIASVPVKTIYRNEKSSINPVKDTIRFIILLLRSYIGK